MSPKRRKRKPWSNPVAGAFATPEAKGREGMEASELLGALSRLVPLEAIGEAIDRAGKRERRKRMLPAELVVQLIIALGLLADAASRQVLAHLLPPAAALPCPRAISLARYRLGAAPFFALFRRLASKPLATDPQAQPWAFYKHLLLISMDGTVLDLPDTPENEKIFGRPGSDKDKAPAGFPQARVVGWLESGARLVMDLAIRPGKRHETAPGLALIRRNARPGQLILWDRGFSAIYAQGLAVLDRGAHFLCRIKKNAFLDAKEVLPDGTYIALAQPREGTGRRFLVRIVEYKMSEKGETIRIATSLTDWREHRAEDLAALYRERWEIETVFDEVKTHQRGRPNGQAATAVRARKPAGVVQEIYALALAHRVVRSLMAAAALQRGLDPDRLSFKNSLVIVRRHLPALSQASSEQLPLF